MRTAKTLIRLGGCPGWSESSLGAYSFCWFCHVAAHFEFTCPLTMSIDFLQPKLHINMAKSIWKVDAANTCITDKWAISWENLSLEVCDLVRLKPTSQSLQIFDIGSIDIILSRQRTAKAMIRLHRCTGWCVPLLFAYHGSWCGSNR